MQRSKWVPRKQTTLCYRTEAKKNHRNWNKDRPAQWTSTELSGIDVLGPVRGFISMKTIGTLLLHPVLASPQGFPRQETFTADDEIKSCKTSHFGFDR
jgi:hypothetical protein